MMKTSIFHFRRATSEITQALTGRHEMLRAGRVLLPRTNTGQAMMMTMTSWTLLMLELAKGKSPALLILNLRSPMKNRSETQIKGTT